MKAFLKLSNKGEDVLLEEQVFSSNTILSCISLCESNFLACRPLCFKLVLFEHCQRRASVAVVRMANLWSCFCPHCRQYLLTCSIFLPSILLVSLMHNEHISILQYPSLSVQISNIWCVPPFCLLNAAALISWVRHSESMIANHHTMEQSPQTAEQAAVLPVSRYAPKTQQVALRLGRYLTNSTY